ncbi:MAG: hypothetical protein ACREC9_06940 [Methylocella sp.]
MINTPVTMPPIAVCGSTHNNRYFDIVMAGIAGAVIARLSR